MRLFKQIHLKVLRDRFLEGDLGHSLDCNVRSDDRRYLVGALYKGSSQVDSVCEPEIGRLHKLVPPLLSSSSSAIV